MIRRRSDARDPDRLRNAEQPRVYQTLIGIVATFSAGICALGQRSGAGCANDDAGEHPSLFDATRFAFYRVGRCAGKGERRDEAVEFLQSKRLDVSGGLRRPLSAINRASESTMCDSEVPATPGVATRRELSRNDTGIAAGLSWPERTRQKRSNGSGQGLAPGGQAGSDPLAITGIGVEVMKESMDRRREDDAGDRQDRETAEQRNPANSFATVVSGAASGPMPERIIEAFTNASIHESAKSRW